VTTLRTKRRGSRRTLPSRPTEDQRAAMRHWLEGDRWVLRPVWERWLATGDDALMVDLDRLTRDQHVAALEWLRQQRHALHDIVEGGLAPPDWLESQTLYRAIGDRLRPDHPA
jgi:hypothetical protein